MRTTLAAGALAAAILPSIATAQSLYTLDSKDAIKKAASTAAWNMMQYYHGNETGATPGILPGPPPAGDYYWWEGGAMWGTLIDYWLLTGDSTYNKEVMTAMQFQVGPNDDYMPPNQTASLGNDDQGFWGMAAMGAAENKFPDPPSDQPGWLALAQGVWATQAHPDRHDKTCGGGLRWQIPFANNGYNYKNSIANGCFFNIGARLARYTKNETYAKYAEQTWDWMEGVGLMSSTNDAVYDGAHVETNCTDINKAEFSYNNAIFTLGAAYMYNYTDGSEKWKARVEKLVDHGLQHFFPDGIAVEPSCESRDTCTTDMKSFKGYIHRWYSTTTKIAPFTAEKILPVLKTSADAAVKTCTGGENGQQCGFVWTTGTFDGKLGVGEMMNIVGATSSLLIEDARAPVSKSTGGTSKGNDNAGNASDDFKKHEKPLTTSDRAGAGILTVLLLGGACGLFGWMSTGA
ncbi:glycosyl hydrolase family 76 domain-containing protein [Sarocladium implicatum]|nr:glycosyl hydrolase family 76 domain-containing protein [Sarocladium implicatum]